MSTLQTAVTNPDSKEAERYYSASQWQLVWWRFKKHKVALFGGIVLIFLMINGIFAEFIGPYDPATRNIDYLLGPPQLPKFWDDNGFSLRPFVHGVSSERDPVTLAMVATTDSSIRNYIYFFVPGDPYSILLGLVDSDIHLFGVEEGFIHLFGTDELGRDLYTRLLVGTRTSLSIGIIGVLISFVLALFIGGVAGYAGGWLDYIIQRFTEIIRVIPIIPLYMGLAAAFPRDWSSTQVYFAMTLIIGLVGWPTLARRIRGQLLTLRDEDYVMAARLSGANPYRIIFLHMLPAFMSYIVVDLVISFPYVILAETALSFVGLGLRPPSISWGVLLQDAQNIRAIEQAPWLFIPAAAVVIAVLSFTILGDGVRDAADPYSVH